MPDFFPFAGQENSEADWRTMAQRWMTSGVIPTTTGQELRVSTSGTTMSVTVGPGRAWVLGHYYENTANVTLPIDRVAVSGNSRYDKVVLHLDLINTGAPRMRLAILKGVEGTNPARPAPIVSGNIYQLEIAAIRVPFLGTTSPLPASAIENAPRYASMGTLTGDTTNVAGPSTRLGPQPVGTVAFDRATSKLLVWNGSRWQDPTPAPTPVDPSVYITRSAFIGEQTSNVGPLSWRDCLVLDASVPATVTPAQLLVIVTFDGLWTGGAGGPLMRLMLNGNIAGQQRTTYSPQNVYVSSTIMDFIRAPAPGAAFTLRVQFASGSSLVTKVRNIIGIVESVG